MSKRTTANKAQHSGSEAAPGRGKVISSAIAAMSVAWAVRLIGLASVLIMARLLTPEDFGLVALAMATLAIVDIFSAIGLRQALLRVRDPEPAHYNTVWTIQLGLLAILALLLVAIAPSAADFYGEPELAIIIVVLSSRFIFFGLANIGIVDFERNFEFGRDMRFRLIVRLLTLVVTVIAAVILRSYWALIIGAVSHSIFHAIASYFVHPFRPRFSLSKKAEMLGVSGWMFLASAAQVVHHEVERLIVGRISSMQTVGFYSVSKGLSSIFTLEIATALNRVTFVTTSRTGQPLHKQSSSLPLLLGAYAMIAGSMGLGLAATAEDSVAVLLGSQWSEAAVFLQIIGPAAAVYAVHKAVVATLQASGNARSAALLSLTGAGLTIASTSAVALLDGSALGVALAALAAVTMLVAIDMVVFGTIAGTSVGSLAAAVIRPFAAALAMLAILRLVAIDTGNVMLDLLIAVPFGGILFALFLSLFWLAMGRPEGAEKGFGDAVRRGWRRVRRQDRSLSG